MCVYTNCRRLCKTTEIFLTIENVFFLFNIYIYIYIYIYYIYILYIYILYICTYIYAICIYVYIKGNHESEKTFLLKTFRRNSSAVKIFCSDPHLKVFKIVVIQIHWRTIKLQKNTSN